jgi:hypothetical protein
MNRICYFFAALVILFAIPKYVHSTEHEPHGRNVVTEQPNEHSASYPHIGLQTASALKDVDLDVEREFVISKLGQPRRTSMVENGRLRFDNFKLASAIVKILYYHNRTIWIYVISTDKNFKPDMFPYNSDIRHCLGCFSFEQAEDPESIDYFDGGNHGVSSYVEGFRPPFSWHRMVYLVLTSEGYMGANYERWVPPEASKALGDIHATESYDDFVSRLPATQRAAVNNFRKNYSPNAWVVVTDDTDVIGTFKFLTESDGGIHEFDEN